MIQKMTRSTRDVLEWILLFHMHSLEIRALSSSTLPRNSPIKHRKAPEIAQPERAFWQLDEGYPGLQCIHSNPHVWCVENFIQPNLCDQLIASAQRDGIEKGNDSGTVASTDFSQLASSSMPEAQLDLSRLWPLAPLLLLSAVPSALHAAGDPEQVLMACLRAWGVTSGIMYLLALAVPRLIEMQGSTTQRTSSSALVTNQTLVSGVIKRAEKLLRADAHTFEAPVVTRYEEGQCFMNHNDASLAPEKDWGGLGGQRLVTVIVYLNDVPRGGETAFPSLRDGTSSHQLRVRPKKGQALVFFPADLDARVDERTLHSGVMAQDTKWICQFWKRQRNVPPPLGLPI
uniref:Fe2OG dioxygenase domain-containing protein n=1 Tax=Octactis speculum TaxID=3111310 RepID=A0A7S2CJC3_9STRA